jgi:hypothetical protein
MLVQGAQPAIPRTAKKKLRETLYRVILDQTSADVQA